MKDFVIAILSSGVGIVAIIIVIRLFYESGLGKSKNDWMSRFLPDEQAHKGLLIPAEETSKVFLAAFLFRIIMLLISFLFLRLLLDDSISFTIGEAMNEYIKTDALHYLNLAELGYQGYVEDGKHLFLVFFPLYPFCIALVNTLLDNIAFSALLVSFLTFAAGSCYLYKLVAYDYGRNVAKNTVLFLSVFPFSFFYGGMMTESLFLFTTCATIYYIRRHRWPLVMLFGSLGALTRMHGILLIAIAGVEWLVYYQPFMLLRKKAYSILCRQVLPKLLWIAGMGMGFIGYLTLNYVVSGSPFTFMIHQKEHWNNETVWFPKTLDMLWEYMMHSEDYPSMIASTWIPEFLIFVLVTALLLYAVRQQKLIYLIYLLSYLLLNYSVSWLLSGGRYISVCIPLFLFLALLTEKRPLLAKAILIVFSILMGGYYGAFLMGVHMY